MKHHVKTMDDAGVSEVIGFILLLALMTMGIGLVGLYGYPQLLQEQSNANFKNMERNMIIIQNDMKSLVYKNVPFQETSMQVSGGSLAVVNPVDGDTNNPYFTFTNNSVDIELVNVTDSSRVTEFHPGELRYNSDGNNAVIGLQNGAVNLHYYSQTGSAMLADPRWYYDADTRTLVVNLIRIHSSGELSTTGIGTVQMKVKPLYELIDEEFASPQIIIIEYHDDPEDLYKTAWDNYFKDKGIFPTSVDGNPYELQIRDVNRLVIKSNDIEILNL